MLLAAVALVIVRKGSVWDDARMIMLVLRLIFSAMSVCFDELVVRHSTAGLRLSICGLLMCVGTSEFLLHGLRMRFPAALRIVYYLMLAQLFVYPSLMAWVLNHAAWMLRGNDFALEWGLFCHSLVSGLLIASLAHQIRGGSQTFRDNGTPWSWPLYPMTLFVFLAAGLGWRNYLLSVTFGILNYQGIYLLPFAAGGVVLLGEVARRYPGRKLSLAALTAPASLVLLAFPGSAGPAETDFGLELIRLAGSPAWLVSWGLVLYYFYAVLRGIRGAQLALSASLVWVAFLSPSALFGVQFTVPSAWPLCLLALQQLMLGWPQRNSARLMAATAALCIAVVSGWPQLWTLGAPSGAVLLHAIWLSALLVGALCGDPFSAALRLTAAVATGGLCLVPWLACQTPWPAWCPWYLTVMAVVSFGYWYAALHGRHRAFLLAWLTQLVHLAGCTAYFGYEWLEETAIARGLQNLVIGLLLLCAGLLVSFYKAGLLAPLERRWQRWWILPASGSSHGGGADWLSNPVE